MTHTSRVRFFQGDVWEGYAGGEGSADTVDIEIYQVCDASRYGICSMRCVLCVLCVGRRTAGDGSA